MKIFLSSTYEDLEDYRRAVRDAILRVGYQPIGMEDFGSQPKEPKVAAIDKVVECEAFVGIYAHRYGTIPDGDSLSITEQEFAKAQEVSIKCLCYRVDPNFFWPEEFKDKGEKSEKLVRFLKRIDGRLLRSLFTTPDDLAKQVGIDIAREFPKDLAFVSFPTLHSIPPPAADFTGRENELTEIMQHFENGATISGLAGMGGVGKTELARVFAHAIKSQYLDAQIEIDLKGTSLVPLAASEVMKQIIHAFEPQADLRKATDNEIGSLYRSTLHDKRALLLLDNAFDAVQVRPLIPSQSCALLITSRRHFTVPGLIPIRLDVMSETDARKFLLELCSRIDGHAAEIAELCGRLPLALRIAGSTLAEHIDITPADYLVRLSERKKGRLGILKEENDPELNVEATFVESYNLQPTDAQTRWRVLAVFRASFTWIAAMEVWALDEESTNISLSEFVRCSLVSFDAKTQRYSLHDLLADFAETRLNYSERTIAQARHAQHYCDLAKAADFVYDKGGDGILQGLSLFDAEWPNISAGQAWATANLETSDNAANLCIEYLGIALYCLDLRLVPRQLISWVNTALRAARKLKERRIEGSLFGHLGAIYRSLGDFDKAVEYLVQSLSIDREIGNASGQSRCLANLGNVYFDLRDYQKATEYYEEARAIAHEMQDTTSEGYILGNLGMALGELGDPRRAVEYMEQAVAIARERGEKSHESSYLGNLGEAYDRRGETLKAIECFNKGLAIAREIGDRMGEVNILRNLGLSYQHQGESGRAIECYERGLEITREIGSTRLESQYLKSLGESYLTLQETSKAAEYCELAMVAARQAGDKRTEANALNSAGLAYICIGVIEKGIEYQMKGIEYYVKGLALARQIGAKDIEGLILSNLGKAYRHLGQTQRAIEFMEQAVLVYQAIKSPLLQSVQVELEDLRRTQIDSA